MAYERQLWLEDDASQVLPVRQMTLVLDEPRRDGETEIRLLTNLPTPVTAQGVAQLSRQRWMVEHVFLNWTTILHGAMNTLPYPKAVLIGFGVAGAAGNVLTTVPGALQTVQGIEKVENDMSDNHLALEVRGKYRGLMIAVLPEEWQPLAALTDAAFATWLLGIAQRVNLERFPKKPRGPKKPRPRRTRFAKANHIATARLLAEERRWK